MSADLEPDDLATETEAELREDLRPWFIPIDDWLATYPQGLNWSDYFGNQNPVELDVAVDAGCSCIPPAAATRVPNYVGIEIEYKEGRRASRRLGMRKLDSPNGRIWGGDVNVAYRKLIAPGSLEAVHVYFPDPW